MSAKILSIAGINFSLQYPDNVVVEERDISYQPFWVEGIRTSPSTTIEVHLRIDQIPQLVEEDKIFDTGESWSMFRRQETCWLVFKPPHFEEPIRIVRFAKNFSSVELFLNPKYVTRKGENQVVADPLHYPVDQLLLMYIMAVHGGVLLHGAGVSFKRRGLVFAGKSGAGKSTLAKQLEKSKSWQVLSDDRMIIRNLDGHYSAYGTPWPGEAGHALNQRVPLDRLMFLHHGNENKLESISARTALERLTHVTSIPWYDRQVMPIVLEHCQKLVDTVPAFDLYFRPDKQVIPFLSEALE